MALGGITDFLASWLIGTGEGGSIGSGVAAAVCGEPGTSANPLCHAYRGLQYFDQRIDTASAASRVAEEEAIAAQQAAQAQQMASQAQAAESATRAMLWSTAPFALIAGFGILAIGTYWFFIREPKD